MIPFIEEKKHCPNLPGPMWKMNCLLNLIAGLPPLAETTAIKWLLELATSVLTSLWRNFGPAFFAELF